METPRGIRTGVSPQPVLSDLRLVGELCVLRPLAARDARAAFPLIHDRDEVLRWLVWGGPHDLAELEQTYGHWRVVAEQGCNYHLAILERERESFCGSLSLRFAQHPRVGDLGYWIGRGAWGRGLGTEAIYLAAHLAFRHLEAERLRAIVFVGNDRSRRALERVGFERGSGSEPYTCPDGRQVRQWSFELARQAFLDRCSGRRPPSESVDVE